MKRALLLGGIVFVLSGTFFIIYYFSHPITHPQPLQKKISIVLPKDFPEYAEYHAFILSHSRYKEVSFGNGDIAISSLPLPKLTKSTFLYQTIYILAGDFKDQGIALSLSEYQTLLSSHSNLSVDASLASVFPSVPVTNDPLSYVRSNQNNYAIIPFDHLTNRYVTIPINSVSPIDPHANMSGYPLRKEYYLYIRKGISLPSDLTAFISSVPHSSMDTTLLHTVIMTGTTAFGRGEFFNIERYGPDYPALYVAPILREGDITDVSDETSFVPTCTQQIGTLKFCAPMSALETLQYSGVNLVELTGNHNNDFGSQYSLSTQHIFAQHGIQYFGGGDTAQDARKPAVFTLGGTTFAFLGYNEPGPPNAFATDTTSGAAKLSKDSMIEDITAAKKKYDVVFVDVQWENENNLDASPSQITLSAAAIDAGADIVTGSSAHRPQGINFYNNGSIFYGLGNLYFDQMENLDTRQNIIVKHTFYGKKLISSELIPTLLYNYSQPRPATGADAQAIFQEVFQASTNL